MLRLRIPLVLVLLAVLIFIAGPSFISYLTDWLWFEEVGYGQIFFTMIGAQALLFVIVAAVASVWLAGNVLIALRSIGDARPVFTTREGLRLALPGRRQLRTIGVYGAVALAVIVGLYMSSQWLVWLAWLHGVPFDQRDPILGHDVGFYVFSLPFLQLVHGLGVTLVILAALAAGGLYLVSGSLIAAFPSRLALVPGARRHLGLLASVFFLLVAFGSWLGRAERLQSAGALIHGASYADVYGRLPASAVFITVALVTALLCAIQAFSARNWLAPVGIALCIVASAGGEVYSSGLQRFVVAPNEQVRETPFITHNIDATRRAFALDGVDSRELSGDATLTRDQLAANAATLDNVRLWDHKPLLDTFGQIQEIRTYYDFVSVDNDRYRINGVPRQVMLSARELNSASLPNRTWVNERLTFTHGYGLTLGPVNQVTSEGLPVLFVRNIPPETAEGITITEPSIYFGELSNDYVIVHTQTREFHYPKGDENVFTQYTGTGGILLNSLWRKLLFAIRFQAYQVLLSNDITPESRILVNRNIRERVRALAPFLSFDNDPYMVVVNGRLFWIYDAYTVSDQYPYSTPAAQGINYVRNAVKIVIDAYHGTTTLYLADAKDPIAATYARIFPGALKPIDQMPREIREHVRYPEDIFAMQASVYATYHMTQPSVFYNREDQWEVPSTEEDREAHPMQPYYTIMRLPGERDAEFIQMLPYTPRRKDNLAAWLVARSDGEHYGTLRVFQFPKQKVIFGPRQVVARMNQDQAISPQITLWNQQGSQVIWGTLMVIPVEESLLYVRPLYLRGEGGRIPELRRVVLTYQNQIVMEDTLENALARMFGAIEGVPPPTAQPSASMKAPSPVVALPGESSGIAALAAEARAHYDRAMEAQRAGDWAKYGEEIKLLGTALEKMRAR
jgi:uncharacterized membrane protein (UPF0182 family)